MNLLNQNDAKSKMPIPFKIRLQPLIILLIVFLTVSAIPTIAPFDSVLLAGDFSWPLDITRFFNSTLYTWDDTVGFGYGAPRQHASLFPFSLAGAFLEYAGLSSFFIQKLFLFVTVLLGLLGFWALCREYGFSFSQGIFGALCYCTSGFAIVYLTPNFGFQFPFYFFLPCGIFLAIKFIKTYKLRFLLALIFLPLTSSFSNPVYWLVFHAMVVVFGPLALAVSATATATATGPKLNWSTIAIRTFHFFLFFFFANLFWIIPFLADLGSSFEGASNAGAIVSSDAQIARQDSLPFSFSTLGMAESFWVVTGGHNGDYYFDFHKFALSHANVLIHGFVLITLVLIYLRKKNYLKGMVFFSATYLLGILITGGLRIGSPLNIPTQIFISHPYAARAFRSLFMKLGVFLAVPWAIIASFALEELWKIRFSWLKFLGPISSVCLLIGIGYPFYTAQIFKKTNSGLPPYWVQIPQEYFDLQAFSKSLNGETALLSLPLATSYNVLLTWPRSGFNGSDFVRNLWNGPVLYGAEGGKELTEIKDCFDQGKTIDCVNKARSFGVRFILVRKDLIRLNDNREPPQSFQFLNLAHQVKLIKDGRYFDLFEIERSNNNDTVLELSCKEEAQEVLPSTATQSTAMASEKDQSFFGASYQKLFTGFYTLIIPSNDHCSQINLRKRGGSGVNKWVLCAPENALDDNSKTTRASVIINHTARLIGGFGKTVACFGLGKNRTWNLAKSKNSVTEGALFYAPQITFIFATAMSILSVSMTLLLLRFKSKRKPVNN